MRDKKQTDHEPVANIKDKQRNQYQTKAKRSHCFNNL